MTEPHRPLSTTQLLLCGAAVVEGGLAILLRACAALPPGAGVSPSSYLAPIPAVLDLVLQRAFLPTLAHLEALSTRLGEAGKDTAADALAQHLEPRLAALDAVLIRCKGALRGALDNSALAALLSAPSLAQAQGACVPRGHYIK